MPLSGKEMLQRFKKAGWPATSQKGSHIKAGKNNLREIMPISFEEFLSSSSCFAPPSEKAQ
jgi:predicted RNA binding protein YcfA (HicA-like mRNA interferase family)